MPKSDTQAPDDCARMYMAKGLGLSSHEWDLLLDALADAGLTIAGQRECPHVDQIELFITGEEASGELQAVFHDPTGRDEDMSCEIHRVIARKRVERGRPTLDL